MKQRLRNLLIAFNQLVLSIITLGEAAPDETMSSAAWRMEQRGRIQGRIMRPLIDFIFWRDPQHCKTSYESEINRNQAPQPRNEVTL